MLKKKNRLSKINVRAKSVSFDTALFKIKIFSNKEEKIRFGFVVSKKVDKRAVVRNKTKRVLKKAAVSLLESVKTGKDIIVFAKKSMDFSQENIIREEMIKILKNI